MKGHDPGVGSPGRKGPKFSREACLDGGEKRFVYILGARNANRNR